VRSLHGQCGSAPCGRRVRQDIVMFGKSAAK
jgi:hypothetical protein